MSVEIKYKGNTIASASTDTTKTLKTSGKYCEADIEVINTPDGGDAPVINPLSVTANGTYNAPSGVDGYSPVVVNVPQGITPTGNIDITENGTYDVTQFASALVNVSGGGSLPSTISKIDGGSFTPASDTVCNTYRIPHNLGVLPKGVYIWCDVLGENTPYTKDRLISWFSGFLPYTNDGSTIRGGEMTKFHRTSGGTAYVEGGYFNYGTEKFGTETDFCAYDFTVSYVSGITYKWIAWA